MNIYVFDETEQDKNADENLSVKESHKLLKKALNNYCTEIKADMILSESDIIREEGQKPYLRTSCDLQDEIHFNVSHSGGLWICAVGKHKVGIDIQRIVHAHYEKISDRYFTENEQEFVKKNGRTGFFRIWACKEAWAKHFGLSIFKVIEDIDTVENGKLKSSVCGIKIKEIDIARDSICMLAMKEGDETVCLKKL